LTTANSSGSKTSEIKITVAMVADHPVISEFMAANETGLQDGDGEFSDWIEIFNPTASSVDLSSYFLTEDSSDLTKWSFPPASPRSGRTSYYFCFRQGCGRASWGNPYEL
jgi:hypothetical protein